MLERKAWSNEVALQIGTPVCAGQEYWAAVCLWTELITVLTHALNPSALCTLLSIDVTEVQIFIIVMYVLAAIGGSAFWQSPVILCSSH